MVILHENVVTRTKRYLNNIQYYEGLKQRKKLNLKTNQEVFMFLLFVLASLQRFNNKNYCKSDKFPLNSHNPQNFSFSFLIT